MKILHVDMDAFFASVAQLDDPSLRGRPVVVGGSPDGRGVVSAASYEARRFGIHSAMPCARAKRLCPDAVFVRGDFRRYREVSRQMHAIFAAYTDQIEPLSLDEAYLDVTENKAGLTYAREVAQAIRSRIREEIGITASAGVAPVKFVAKIASDFRKPDGLTVVTPDRLLEFLHPLPVRKLPGVGPATAKRIHAAGIHTIGDLYHADPIQLSKALGSRSLYLQRMAHGQDPRRVSARGRRKSRGSERTLHEDEHSLPALKDLLFEQLRALCDGLRRAEERARTVTVKIRYGDFETITRAATLQRPTHDPTEVRPVVEALLERTEAGSRPVRLIGVSFSNFLHPVDPGAQLGLPFESAPG